jgi:hypothetical protein
MKRNKAPKIVAILCVLTSALLISACAGNLGETRVFNAVPDNFFVESCEPKPLRPQVITREGGYELWILEELGEGDLLYAVGQVGSDCYLRFPYKRISGPIQSVITDQPLLNSYHRPGLNISDSLSRPPIAFYQETSELLFDRFFAPCLLLESEIEVETCRELGNAGLNIAAATLTTVDRTGEFEAIITVDLIDGQIYAAD